MASGKSIPNCQRISVGVFGLLATNRRSSQSVWAAICRSSCGSVSGLLAICAADASGATAVVVFTSCIVISMLGLPISRLLTHRLEYPDRNLKMKVVKIIYRKLRSSSWKFNSLFSVILLNSIVKGSIFFRLKLLKYQRYFGENLSCEFLETSIAGEFFSKVYYVNHPLRKLQYSPKY